MKTKEPIAEHRKAAGMTIEAAAAQFCVDRTTIIRWENGQPRIPLKRLEDAERIYDVPRSKVRPDIFGQAS